MAKEINLLYKPLEIENLQITEPDFDNYVFSSALTIDIPKKVIIEPLEEALKDSDEKEFIFSGGKVTKSVGGESTSWKPVYDSVLQFLRIRADDSRAFNMDGVKQFEGVGYCILIPDLKGFIEERIKENTSSSDSITLNWPKVKKNEEYPTRLTLPRKDYSETSTENIELCLKAKRFCSGLKEGVIGIFKDTNQAWFETRTGYNKNNLPERENSPLREIREIAEGKFVFINLVREEKPQYKEIVSFLTTKLNDLSNGVVLEGYKTKQAKEGVYVNIKNVHERLQEDRLKKDDLIKIAGRYEIVP